MTSQSALLFGATGQVGGALLRDLLQNSKFEKVTSVGRRSVPYDGPNKEKLIQEIIDFENLEKSRDVFKGHDVIFNALGTTRALAGSAEAFRRIDRDYVVNSAKVIKEVSDRPQHFLYCSSGGSNKDSFFLYMKTKGETEHALGEIGFEKVTIMQPATLLTEGEREQPRIAEKVAQKVLSAVDFGKILTIPVSQVAIAMRKIAEGYKVPNEPTKVSTNSSMYHIGNRAIIQIAESQ